MKDKQKIRDEESAAAAARTTGCIEEDEETSTCGLLAWILPALNVINHVLVLLVTGYVAYRATRDLGVTAIHALLCTIGYPFLMAQAIVALAGENAWSRFFSRRANSNVHWVLQVVGAVCTFTGVSLMYIRKADHQGLHLPRSTHAIYGGISVAGICLVFLTGLPALFAGSLRKKIRPVYSKFTHNSVGMTCFLLGMVSQCYGYQKGFIRGSAPEMVLWMTLATAAIAVLSLLGAVRQYRQQFAGVVKALLR